MREIITQTSEETIALGYKIGSLVQQGAVILLEGDLASGKTTLTKGIAKALGIEHTVNSPTFTIMKIYEGSSQTLYHLDLYRLTEVGYDFDLEDYIDHSGVIVIEWPKQVVDLLPKEAITIHIESLEETKRKFVIEASPLYEEVVNNI